MKISLPNLTIILTLIPIIAFSQEMHIGGVNVFVTSNDVNIVLHEIDLTLENHEGVPGEIYSRGTITLTGNLNVNTLSNPFNGYSEENGLLIFKGAYNSYINGTTAAGIHNLTIDKSSGGLYLNTPLNIGGMLTLTSGIIHSNITNVLTLDKGAVVSDGKGSQNSHVSGYMRKVADVVDSEFVFPIGTGTIYRPVGFKDVDGATIFGAQHIEDLPAMGWDTEPESEGNVVDGKHLHRISNVEYWELESSNSVGAKVVLSWDDDYSQLEDPEFLIATVWNESAWRNLGVNLLDEENNQLDSYDPTALFGEFRLGSYQSIKMGDVNNDGIVNILDIVWMVNFINEIYPEGFNIETADLNNDGVVNVLDLVILIDVILERDKKYDKTIESELAHLYLNEDGIVGFESDGTLTALHFQLTSEQISKMKTELLLDSDHMIFVNKEKGLGLIYSLSNTVFEKGYIDLFEVSGIDLYSLEWSMAEASNIGYKMVEVATHKFNEETIMEEVADNNLNLNIYPNPTKGMFYMKFNLPHDAMLELEIIDHSGRIVYKRTSTLYNQGEHILELNLLSESRSGLYLLRISGKEISGSRQGVERQEKILLIK